VTEGRISRLLINFPPRSAKTIIRPRTQRQTGEGRKLKTAVLARHVDIRTSRANIRCGSGSVLDLSRLLGGLTSLGRSGEPNDKRPLC
jgi:hypothetical protein